MSDRKEFEMMALGAKDAFLKVADEGTFKINLTGKTADLLKPFVGKTVFMGLRPEDFVYAEQPAKEIAMAVAQGKNIVLQDKENQWQLQPHSKFQNLLS